MFKRLIILAVLLVWAGPLVFADDYPRLNGVQLFVLDKKYDRNLDELFAGIKAKGYDTVFLRVFHNSVDRYHFGDDFSGCVSGVYFRTDEACVVRDVLGEAVPAARRNGLKIYAWMATRSLSFLKSPENMERKFDNGSITEGYGASIFSPAVKETVTDLFEDLAKYDIDGILFQDDFIMRNREGASEDALEAYVRDTGIELNEADLFGCEGKNPETQVTGTCSEAFIRWTQWKNDRMMSFFSGLKRAVMEINPNIQFAGNVYYETPLDPVKGMSWYAQSIDSMKANGFDYFAVMGYHDQIAQELGLSASDAVKTVDEIASSMEKSIPEKSRILMKIQRISFDKTRTVTDDDFKSVCAVLDSHKEISRAVVPVYSLDDLSNNCPLN